MSIISDSVVVLTDPGTLTAATLQAAVTFPFAVDIISVTPSVTVAPTGASVIFDVNNDGTTIFTTQANRPTIAASALFGAPKSPDAAARRVNVGDVVSVDCDQIGSGTAGSNGSLAIAYRAAADVPTN